MASIALGQWVAAAFDRVRVALAAEPIDLYDDDYPLASPEQTTAPIRFIYTGTWACDAWERGEDIHVLCVAGSRPALFWRIVVEALNLPEEVHRNGCIAKGVLELSDPSNCVFPEHRKCLLHDFVSLSKSTKADCKFFLHYVEARNARSLSFTTLDVSTRPASRNTAGTLPHGFDSLQEEQALAQSTRGEPYGKQHLRRLVTLTRNWARLNGLYGGKFGLIDSRMLVEMVCSAYAERRSRDGLDGGIFEDCEDGALLDLFVLEPVRRRLDYQGTDNVSSRISRHLTLEGQQALRSSLARQRPRSRNGTRAITNAAAGFDCFLEDSAYLCKVEAECWSVAAKTRSDFRDEFVPANLLRAVECTRGAIEGAYLRIWPVPLVDSMTHQVYAVGLALQDGAKPFAIPSSNVAAMLDYINETVLDYDATTGIISIALATKEDLTEYLATEKASRATLSVEDDIASRSQAKSQNGKFLDARRAIDRLRFDHKHAGMDYEVGYEDRFAKELLWMPLEAWGKKETEEDEWIPQHRVRRLRRVHDQKVVWNRECRIDVL